jgi:DNA-directed RNA polymerase subunit L/DNA-directed RNA polymerase alpha subunit
MFSSYSESGPFLLNNREHRLSAAFRLRNTNVTMANTLRRAVLVHTPTVGFRTEPYEKSKVRITKNTTPLVNEMIAHRVGMIPIAADPNTFDPEKYMFKLDVENAGKTIIDVRAADFKVYMRNPTNPLDAPILQKTEDFFPPDPITGETILITRLRPQWNPTAPTEHIQLEAVASISSGAENIRWSPVSQASYEYTRDDDEAHINAVFSRWLESSKKIADVSGLDPVRREELMTEFNTMEVQRCYITDERGEPNDFTFHIESVGVQSVPMIVRSALASCEVLLNKYQDIDSRIPDSVRVQQGDTWFASIDFIFQDESHTLGNLLEMWIAANGVDGDAITYVGYKVPHPLRPELYVRIGVKESLTPESQKDTARAVVAKACRALKEDFRAFAAEWAKLVPLPSYSSGGVAETKDDA